DALVFEALVRLHDAEIPVVAIPGNHDSAIRLEALARLLARIGVTVVPRVVPPGRGSLVEVPARDGGGAALVAAVPFLPGGRPLPHPLRRLAAAAGLRRNRTDEVGDHRGSGPGPPGQGQGGCALRGPPAARRRGHPRRGAGEGPPASRRLPPGVRGHGWPRP